ncbi:MAG: type III-B CRISPR module-associated Cmr3 family protein [Pseudomonadota bacterium]
MNGVKQWLSIDPLDTLFFRGSEPMIAGESHEVRSIFPPMPSTVVGAIRTAILRQRGIEPTGLAGQDREMSGEFTFLGTPGKSGFDVLGPLLEVEVNRGETDRLVPAPAHWFADLSEAGTKPAGNFEVRVSVADELPSDLKASLGLCGSVANPIWTAAPTRPNLKSLSGSWVNLSALQCGCSSAFRVNLGKDLDALVPSSPALVRPESLYSSEIRVGIALEAETRRVRQGRLYSAAHVRLRHGVRMVVGLSHELCPGHLDDSGLLHLGGEQRFAAYRRMTAVPLIPLSQSPWVMSLSPFEYDFLNTQGWGGLHRASGPLIRMGGWDMLEGFHKPIRSFLPAGTAVKVGVDAEIPFGFIRI